MRPAASARHSVWKPAWEHLPAALAVALAAFLLTGDPLAMAAALAWGWLLDIDHLADLAVVSVTKRRMPSLGYALRGLYFNETQRLFILLHAWEWVPAWALGLAALGRPAIGVAGAAALALHLAKDSLDHEHMRPWGYFILWRMALGFDKTRFLTRHDPYQAARDARPEDQACSR